MRVANLSPSGTGRIEAAPLPLIRVSGNRQFKPAGPWPITLSAMRLAQVLRSRKIAPERPSPQRGEGKARLGGRKA
jgi:hypothetical protein